MPRPAGIAPPAPVPRVVNENLRAPAGLTRFKCEAVTPDRRRVCDYVLAETADSAAEHFRARRKLATAAAVEIKALPD